MNVANLPFETTGMADGLAVSLQTASGAENAECVNSEFLALMTQLLGSEYCEAAPEIPEGVGPEVIEGFATEPAEGPTVDDARAGQQTPVEAEKTEKEGAEVLADAQLTVYLLGSTGPVQPQPIEVANITDLTSTTDVIPAAKATRSAAPHTARQAVEQVVEQVVEQEVEQSTDEAAPGKSDQSNGWRNDPTGELPPGQAETPGRRLAIGHIISKPSEGADTDGLRPRDIAPGRQPEIQPEPPLAKGPDVSRPNPESPVAERPAGTSPVDGRKLDWTDGRQTIDNGQTVAQAEEPRTRAETRTAFVVPENVPEPETQAVRNIGRPVPTGDNTGEAMADFNGGVSPELRAEIVEAPRSEPVESIRPEPTTSRLENPAAGVRMVADLPDVTAVNPSHSVSSVPPRMAEVSARVINQVVRAAKTRFFEGGAAITLRLDPPHLGTVHMQVTAVGGSVTALLQTSTESARQIFQADIAQLREALAQAGVNVDTINVSVGTGADQGWNLYGKDGQPGNGYGRSNAPWGFPTDDADIDLVATAAATRSQSRGGFDYLA